MSKKPDGKEKPQRWGVYSSGGNYEWYYDFLSFATKEEASEAYTKIIGGKDPKYGDDIEGLGSVYLVNIEKMRKGDRG